MNTWKLTFERFDPEKEALREALCTLGNGYFGTRGAAQEMPASKVHYPGTYIAGVYNELITPIAGHDVVNEDFVNCPNWLMFNYRIDDDPWFNRLKVKILSWRKELNMKRGVLLRRLRWQDSKGRITLVENERIVSMANPHFAALRVTIIPENYSGKITIRSGTDGLILNAGVERYRQLNSKHLEPYAAGTFGRDGIYLQMQTNQSKIQISEAIRTLVYKNHTPYRPKMKVITHGKQRIMHEFTLNVKKGERYIVEKLVSIYTSRDPGVPDNLASAQDTIGKVENFNSLYKSHQARWKALWKKYDIVVEGDDFVQQILRLHTFHLLQVASTYNEEIDAGLTARGLHGEAYRGHIFWDELYVFPFYNLRSPEITRALLMYRYRRLNAAKEYARQHGYKGAMYPWQSASAGNETTQTVHLNPLSGKWGDDYSSLQRHVSIAVAYNVWSYYQLSGDRDFLEHYGAEMILEISHFWSSIAQYDSRKKRYFIEGVMGPDEFHEKYPGSKKGGLKNNAYTNVMVVWVLEKALELLGMLTEEERAALLLKVGVDDEELNRWEDITHKMTVPMDKNGLIHQFEGYMSLKELDWSEYREKYENLHRVDRILKAEGLSPDEYKVAKQADTMLLFYMLSFEEIKRIFTKLKYPCPKQIIKKNYDYYIRRTSHGSTLSKIVHSYLAEIIGDTEVAMDFFIEALESDVYDTQGGTAQEGIHAGVMGGTITIFLRSFIGLVFLNDRLGLNPRLPKYWRKVRFNIRYKNISYDITLTGKKIQIVADVPKEMLSAYLQEVPVEIEGKKYMLSSGKLKTILL